MEYTADPSVGKMSDGDDVCYSDVVVQVSNLIIRPTTHLKMRRMKDQNSRSCTRHPLSIQGQCDY